MKTAIIFLIFCVTFLVSVQGHRELDDRRPTQNAHKKKPTTVEKIAKDELKVLRAPQAYGNVVIQNQGKLFIVLKGKLDKTVESNNSLAHSSNETSTALDEKNIATFVKKYNSQKPNDHIDESTNPMNNLSYDLIETDAGNRFKDDADESTAVEDHTMTLAEKQYFYNPYSHEDVSFEEMLQDVYFGGPEALLYGKHVGFPPYVTLPPESDEQTAKPSDEIKINITKVKETHNKKDQQTSEKKKEIKVYKDKKEYKLKKAKKDFKGRQELKEMKELQAQKHRTLQ